MDDHRIAEPFHHGELQAQALAGGGPAGAPIRNRMPEQHRGFFQQLSFICVGVTDCSGWPLATVLHGAPGFVTAPTDARLDIAAWPDADDPAQPLLTSGARVGLLGIDLATRRRNRVNGVVAQAGATGFCVGVQQSFGNCPKYIRVRQLERVERGERATMFFEESLPDAAAALIARCETMFIASSSGAAAQPLARGVDISHRGGPAGFVRVDGPVLTIPDYPGNRYFNTLGNLLLEPRAALALVDFDTGDVLQLQGVAEVSWRADALPEDPLAQRAVRFQVARGWLRKAAFPLASVART
jgi:predicted pyridoxine 5'-phosphate oxidase superfamily flavin-nucleotide-binding protein